MAIKSTFRGGDETEYSHNHPTTMSDVQFPQMLDESGPRQLNSLQQSLDHAPALADVSKAKPR